MADPAARELIGRAGGRAGVLLLLVACSQDPAAAPPPPAFDDAAITAPIPVLPPNTTRVSLVDHDLWQQLGSEEDPFADRPASFDCAAEAVAAEVLAGERAYGVDTGACSYVTARQVTARHATAGETVVVRLWHFALNAPDPGEAHAVVDVDGLRLLDERVAIPAPGGLIRVELPIDRAIAAGAPVYFHLHNHGENSWALVEISTGP